ncbi:MAG: hypothetical protein ACD_44C00481G0005 [uncultured bacterium]|nr:MAG: hypothetical protein ACD_44C00481G0005 [uncultured bacterium]OGT15257.1 MAG: hypothetical protein A3B69_02550 [Gammaproteobacteria bacterium RIFCSPHIGHO2_02_FULL_38_33]OGT23926.1 MAG: hypothetical protein A2W47_01720 [Gammaproteobacteria bacterium RIFCSPHIGHO2_12_38_15]OGT67748.1 MAG: hypothetical protein A3I12_03675 [Gammaproteobacteria bacterium RIFCSPLOWO2_02_FULL_38_11]
MQKLDNVLVDDKGEISLLNTHGYTSLQLSGQHAHGMVELDQKLCALLKKKFDFEFVTAGNTLTASNIAKTSFFENLPSKPFYIDPGDTVSARRHLLNPSVCYHCFDYYSRKYQKSTQLLCSVAKCFRNEESSRFDPYRLCEFTMREFVVIGEPKQVNGIGTNIFNCVTEFINNLVPVKSVNACDSFMGGNVEVLKKVQKALALKQELVFQTNLGPVSTASVNWHKKTMASKYIQREEIESCCIAIGLERLYLGTLRYAH